MKITYIKFHWNFPRANELIISTRTEQILWLFVSSDQCDTVITLRPRQNGRHFPDAIFKWIFLNENVWISIKISLKFVPKVPIKNIPALVQIMSWRRSGDKPLSEPMMDSLLTHMRHSASMSYACLVFSGPNSANRRLHLPHSAIGKTPVRIILWCPITKMLIKACFLVQPLEQEGVYQKCCISLCSKVFINHFYQMKASPECLNILTYRSKYWVDRLRRTIGRKV